MFSLQIIGQAPGPFMLVFDGTLIGSFEKRGQAEAAMLAAAMAATLRTSPANAEPMA